MLTCLSKEAPQDWPQDSWGLHVSFAAGSCPCKGGIGIGHFVQLLVQFAFGLVSAAL